MSIVYQLLAALLAQSNSLQFSSNPSRIFCYVDYEVTVESLL